MDTNQIQSEIDLENRECILSYDTVEYCVAEFKAGRTSGPKTVVIPEKIMNVY